MSRPRRRSLALGALGLVVGGFVVAELAYFYILWPDWNTLRRSVPKSSFIARYEQQRNVNRSLPPLRWRPVSGASWPAHVPRVFVLAEDSRFYSHFGLDPDAIVDAFLRATETGELTHGASTISQQTAKNLFLNPSRSFLRKWHELWLTLFLERNLTKQRILSIYLNIVELGRGVYGVEAAAQRYFGKSAHALTVEEAAALAAALPSPVLHNPATNTEWFRRRKARILGYVAQFGATP